MAYSIQQTQGFSDQLEDTVDYILTTLHSPQAARSLLDAYEQTLRLIKQSPTWLPVDQAASARFDTVVYKVSVRSYLLRYWVDEASSTVHLISFRHQSRDYTTFMDHDAADEN